MSHSKDQAPSNRVTEASVTADLSQFQHPNTWKGVWQIINSFVPYIALWWLAVVSLRYSYWLTIPIMILAAGFLIRIFIIFHDCGHGSFFRSKLANRIVGTISGILTFTPYDYWRSAHAKHHATSANLDKRGFGDVWMMTVEEYRNASRSKRWQYRLYRNPFVMFGLGPLFIFLVTHRIVRRKANRQERTSVYLTNASIIAIAAILIWAIGIKAYLLVQLPIMFCTLVAGIWLFYVQHQFDGVYWARAEEWDYFKASVLGGSYYRLPAVLNWFTGNIGYHHVHHLNSRIPNYNLPKCHKKIRVFDETPTFGFWTGFKSLRFRLWDEESGALVSFRALKKRRGQFGGDQLAASASPESSE
ncbi:MAG TPA: fatty acid desaturase [candidate division Zixibacteria bacterium]|nr:fatty acid desaturase [candidate division Zixibacteria bacterium]